MFQTCISPRSSMVSPSVAGVVVVIEVVVLAVMEVVVLVVMVVVLQ